MNYPQRNNRKNNRYKNPLQVSAVAVIIVIFLHVAVPGALDSFFTFVFAPLWRMEHAASAEDFFATHSALVAENASLEDEIISLAPAESAIAALEQENVELKALLGRAPSDKMVLAAVLKTPPFSAYDSLVIDVGSAENIQAGDQVFAATVPFDDSSTTVFSPPEDDFSATSSISSGSSTTGILMPIGTVSETYADSSKVELFSASGNKYSVEIGPDNIPAEAVSQGGGMFSAQVAQGTDINVGDPVTIPDIETITFGTVGAVVNDPAQPYTNVLFNEPVNMYQLRWVLVEHEPLAAK